MIRGSGGFRPAARNAVAIAARQNDKLVLPLQAADTHAWYVRREMGHKVTGVAPVPIGGVVRSTKSMPSLSVEWEEVRLRRAFLVMFYPDTPPHVLFKL